MPTRAFLKLAPERREEIMSVCREEFGRHGYAAASTNAMVERLGVAKGSLFYWFGSKDELYLHLLDEAARRFAEALGRAAAERPREILARLRALVHASLDLLERSPASYRLLAGFLDGQAGYRADRASREPPSEGLAAADTTGLHAPAPEVERLLAWVVAGIRTELLALVDRTADAQAARSLLRWRLDAAIRLLARAIYGTAAEGELARPEEESATATRTGPEV